MPCTIPPCIWPASSLGFTITPQSATAVKRSMRLAPVSGSISTSQTMTPVGNDSILSANTASPSKRFQAANSSRPMRRSVPTTSKLPSRKATSAGEVSSRSAARSRPRLITSSAARRNVVPLMMVEDEPPVPPPRGIVRVSPCRISIFSGGTPSAADRIWPKIVS